MNSEYEIPQVESEKDTGAFLSVGDFERISLPSELPVYKGEGETSFAEKYDNDKLEYLKTMGIEFPEEWKEDRALLVSTFVVAGLIVVLEGVRRDDRGVFEEVLREKNKQLNESRIDEFGYRRRLSNGLLVEDYHRKLGFSANPQKKVSAEEIKGIVSYLLEDLSPQTH